MTIVSDQISNALRFWMVECFRLRVPTIRSSSNYFRYEAYVCYQFRVPRNLRIDIKDRLEEHSQSIEIDIHVSTRKCIVCVEINQYQN